MRSVWCESPEFCTAAHSPRAGNGGRGRAVSPGIAKGKLSWYSEHMEQTPFELTPEQKGILATLSRETGKPIAALIAQALAALQEHARLEQAHEMSNGHDTGAPGAAETRKPFWQKALEASQRIPEEELARLPADLAA